MSRTPDFGLSADLRPLERCLQAAKQQVERFERITGEVIRTFEVSVLVDASEPAKTTEANITKSLAAAKILNTFSVSTMTSESEAAQGQVYRFAQSAQVAQVEATVTLWNGEQQLPVDRIDCRDSTFTVDDAATIDQLTTLFWERGDRRLHLRLATACPGAEPKKQPIILTHLHAFPQMKSATFGFQPTY
jgi:hypothetical protein